LSKPKDKTIKTPKRKGEWVEGNVQEFLSLSDADMELIEMLQTGQVLFRRLSVDFALVLPFKDSQRGG